MKPVLFPAEATEWTSQGIGALSDAVSCTVTEERNGAFELEMTYPIDGVHFKDIVQRSLIVAKPNQLDDRQPFRVYEISKPLFGMVTVRAEHISYDLSGIPVSPFTAESAPEALSGLKSHSATYNPFRFWTDKETVASFSVKQPSSLRSRLGGVQGSILDVYGGEYKWDGYTVRLYGARGRDRGVSIRYGKNMTDLRQEENCAGVYTGVYPYYADADGNVTQLSEKIVNAPGEFGFVRILPLDLSEQWQAAPTEDQLRDAALKYINDNSIGVPKVSLTVSFVQLGQTEEYKYLSLLEHVGLCDAVEVSFPKMGVQAKAKCIKIVYDVLLDRYISAELGSARTNIADTIAVSQQTIEQLPTQMAQDIRRATQLITGNLGGYVVLHDSNGDGEPDEILIMDTPDIHTAVHVWRWNKSGLGYSSAGYDGPYGTAITSDGQIVADFITTGVLTADLIKAGVLQSVTLSGETPAFSLNLRTGAMTINSVGGTHWMRLVSGLLSGGIATGNERTAYFSTDSYRIENGQNLYGAALGGKNILVLNSRDLGIDDYLEPGSRGTVSLGGSGYRRFMTSTGWSDEYYIPIYHRNSDNTYTLSTYFPRPLDWNVQGMNFKKGIMITNLS